MLRIALHAMLIWLSILLYLRVRASRLFHHLRAGVCRPCVETELTATIVGISAYVDESRKFALIGNLLDTVDRGRKRAYVVKVEHGRLSATGYLLSSTSCMRS